MILRTLPLLAVAAVLSAAEGGRKWVRTADAWGPPYCHCAAGNLEGECRAEHTHYQGPRLCESPAGQDLTGQDCSSYAVGQQMKTKYAIDHNFTCMESRSPEPAVLPALDIRQPLEQWCTTSMTAQFKSFLRHTGQEAAIFVVGVQQFRGEPACRLDAHATDFDGTKIDLNYYVAPGFACAVLEGATRCHRFRLRAK